MNPEFANYRRSIGWRPGAYNLLFRWFVELDIDDGVWDHSTSSKNRDRLLNAEVAAKSLEVCCVTPLLSNAHFSVHTR